MHLLLLDRFRAVCLRCFRFRRLHNCSWKHMRSKTLALNSLDSPLILLSDFFSFFSCICFHLASFARSNSSLQTRIQATLRSRLNSCTGFRNAPLSFGRRMCEVFSVCKLNPSGTVIASFGSSVMVEQLRIELREEWYGLKIRDIWQAEAGIRICTSHAR